MLAFLSCSQHRKQFSDIIIDGNVKGIPDGKLYLYNSFLQDRKPIDSTLIKNGQFTFKLKADSNFYPHDVWLAYYDSTEQGFVREHEVMLGGYINPFHEKTIMSTFFLDRGTTVITGEKKEPLTMLTVEGSAQNESFYKNDYFFGSLRGTNNVQRAARIKRFENTIKKDPQSFFLLKGLWMNRSEYEDDELKKLLHLFGDDIFTSAAFKKFTTYFDNKNFSRPYTHLDLESPDGNMKPMFDRKAKINMLIFWGSGCVPCRKEIPDLKKIYEKYSDWGLSMCSISLDNNLKSWNRTLRIEQMPWEQRIVNDSANKILDVEYNLHVIPIIILTDSNGNLIKRIEGQASKEELEKYLSGLKLQ